MKDYRIPFEYDMRFGCIGLPVAESYDEYPERDEEEDEDDID